MFISSWRTKYVDGFHGPQLYKGTAEPKPDSNLNMCQWGRSLQDSAYSHFYCKERAEPNANWNLNLCMRTQCEDSDLRPQLREERAEPQADWGLHLCQWRTTAVDSVHSLQLCNQWAEPRRTRDWIPASGGRSLTTVSIAHNFMKRESWAKNAQEPESLYEDSLKTVPIAHNCLNSGISVREIFSS